MKTIKKIMMIFACLALIVASEAFAGNSDDLNEKNNKKFLDFKYFHTSNIEGENNLNGYYEKQYSVNKDANVTVRVPENLADSLTKEIIDSIVYGDDRASDSVITICQIDGVEEKSVSKGNLDKKTIPHAAEYKIRKYYHKEYADIDNKSFILSVAKGQTAPSGYEFSQTLEAEVSGEMPFDIASLGIKVDATGRTGATQRFQGPEESSKHNTRLFYAAFLRRNGKYTIKENKPNGKKYNGTFNEPVGLIVYSEDKTIQ